MNSYILKNTNKDNEVLLYQESVSYSFTPKKESIKKVTILDNEMINIMYENKLKKEYERLLKIIYSIVSSEDSTSGDVLIAYQEIDRIRQYLLSLREIDKDLKDKYLKKLYILEEELKKVDIREIEEGRGR